MDIRHTESITYELNLLKNNMLELENLSREDRKDNVTVPDDSFAEVQEKAKTSILKIYKMIDDLVTNSGEFTSRTGSVKQLPNPAIEKVDSKAPDLSQL